MYTCAFRQRVVVCDRGCWCWPGSVAAAGRRSRMASSDPTDNGRTLAVRHGCDHTPHTVFCELTNEAMCRACADNRGIEGAYLSTYAYEAESLLDELEARRHRATDVLRTCPTMLDLERMRDAAKHEVDLYLLEVVKAVDVARNRLHSDIDEVVGARVTATTEALMLTRQLQALKLQCDGLGRGSDATGEAVVALRLLKRSAPALNDMSTRTAQLAQPFQIRLRKELCKLDLAALQIVTSKPPV